MTHQLNCLECSKFQNQLNRQNEMISQLVRIVATTNERVTALEERVTSNSNVSVSFPKYSSNPMK